MRNLSTLTINLSVLIGALSNYAYGVESTNPPVESNKSAVETASATNSEKSDVTQTLQYDNTEKRYTIDYPRDWQRKEMPKLDLVLFVPGKDGSKDPVASMNIVSEKIAEQVTLDQFFNESVENIKIALKDTKIEKSGDKTIHNTPTKWVIYTHEMQGIKFEVIQFFAVENDIVYLLTFSSPASTFESFKGNFDKISESFRVKKGK